MRPRGHTERQFCSSSLSSVHPVPHFHSTKARVESLFVVFVVRESRVSHGVTYLIETNPQHSNLDVDCTHLIFDGWDRPKWVRGSLSFACPFLRTMVFFGLLRADENRLLHDPLERNSALSGPLSEPITSVSATITHRLCGK